VNGPRAIASRMIGHEERHLMARVKIIEVHGISPGSKRERDGSLSRTGLQ
jgi:hypothetical protein